MFPLFAARVATAEFFRPEIEAGREFTGESESRRAHLTVVRSEMLTHAKPSAPELEFNGLNKSIELLLKAIPTGEFQTFSIQNGKRVLNVSNRGDLVELAVSLAKEPHIRRSLSVSRAKNATGSSSKIVSAKTVNERTGVTLDLRDGDRALQLVKFEVLSAISTAIATPSAN